MVGNNKAAAVRFFPPAIPLFVIVVGICLELLVPLQMGFSLPSPARYWIGGFITIGALLGLGAWSVYLLRRDGQSENPWKPTHKIIKNGPFRITRNPMYLQMVIICIGVAIMLMNWWILFLTPICALLLHKIAILPEEAYLEEKFGEAYLSYKRCTRRWI